MPHYLQGINRSGERVSIELDNKQDALFFKPKLEEFGTLKNIIDVRDNSFPIDNDLLKELQLPTLDIEMVALEEDDEIEVEVVVEHEVFVISSVYYKEEPCVTSPNRGIYFSEEEARFHYKQALAELKSDPDRTVSFSVDQTEWSESGDPIALAFINFKTRRTIEELKLEKWLCPSNQLL